MANKMNKEQLIQAINTASPDTKIADDATVKQLIQLLSNLDRDATVKLALVQDVRKSLVLADKLTVQAGIAHAATIKTLQELGIEWKNITKYLQLVVFHGDYPMSDKTDKEGNAKPKPLSETRATVECGRQINCFNSYRSRWSDYGVERQRITSPVQHVATSEEVEKAKGKAETGLAEKKAESTTSKAVIVDKESIPAALKLMFADCQDGMVKDSLLIVADYYNVELA